MDLGPNIEYGPRRDRSVEELHAKWSTCATQPNFERQFSASFSEEELASANYEFSFNLAPGVIPAGCSCSQGNTGRVGATVSTVTDQIATEWPQASDGVNDPSCTYISRGEKPLSSNFDPPILPDVSYDFRVGAHVDPTFSGHEVTCDFRIRYIPEENHEAGGLRVNSITRIRGGEPEVTNFIYDKNDKSTGEIIIEPNYGYSYSSSLSNNIFFTSTPVNNTADINGYFFGYKSVTTIIGDVKSEYKFKLVKQNNRDNFPILPTPIHYLNGQQDETVNYKGESFVEQQMRYVGNTIEIINPNVEQDLQVKLLNLVCPYVAVPYLTQPPGYYRLEGTVETRDGLTSSTSYTYGGTHLQPTSVTFSGPDASRTTSYKYAEDLNDTELLTRHMITIPLETKIDGGAGGGSKTVYDEMHGYIVPHEFYRWNADDNNWDWVAMHKNYTNDGFPGVIEKRGFDASRSIITQSLTWDDRLLTDLTTGSRHQSFSYYKNGHRQLESLTTIDGQTTTFAYDGLWRLMQEQSRGELITNTYTYNYAPANDENINSVYKDVKITDTGYAFNTEQVYDAFGRPIASIKEKYTSSISDWVESQTYNALGSVITKCDPALGSCYNYTYYPSALQRLYTEQQGTWPNPVEYLYGAEEGLYMTQRTSEDGVDTKTLTDGLGRTRKTIDGLGQPTSYNYDSRGNITSISGPAGEYIYAYDGLGRLETKTVPDGGVYTYDYYENDLLKTTTDPKGQATTNDYTLYGELEHVYDGLMASGTPISSYAYGDGTGDAGKLLTADVYQSRGGQTIRAYTYDQYGRVRNESVSTGYFTANYDHTDIDNADFVKQTNRDGIIYNMDYDHGGRQVSSSADWQGTMINTFNEYNDHDWRTVHRLGGTEEKPLQKVDYGYNERGWLTSINGIDQIRDRQLTGAIPQIKEDDLIEILVDLETGYDLEDIIACNPTNLYLGMEGTINVLTGENKGSYPFSKQKEIPLYGGKTNTNFSTQHNYALQGQPNYLNIRDDIKVDLLSETGIVEDPAVKCQECSFEAYLGDKNNRVSDLYIDGENILYPGNVNYDLSLEDQRTKFENRVNTWLSDNGGGTVTVLLGSPRAQHYSIRLEGVSLGHVYDYVGLKGVFLGHFVSPLGAVEDCELTCDYDLTDAQLTQSDACQARELKSMKIGDEYVPFDSGLNFTDASDREKIRDELLTYLNTKGYYYSSVVVRADGIEVNGTNAPIDRVSTNCEENSAHLRNHYFTRTCDPICEAGLLCWIEQVLPEIIRDFFDTEIFEDYTPACLEPEADPSTCLDCVLCPEQCDLFAEEIYYKQADDNINATSWYAGNISHTKWMTSYSGQAQSYTYDYDAIDRLKTAKSGSYAASQPGWTDHQWGLNTNYDVTIGYADGAGNISSINRAGVTHRDSYGLPIYGGIDNLTLYYDQTKPNQLTSITETTDQEHLTKGFKPYNQSMPESGEILYDANGNMTKNDFKGIKNITYDIYNYPKLIEFNDDVSTIEMDYSADGNKLWMKVSKAGESPKEFSYLDGMVVRLNGEESLYADGGRITDAAGDYRAEYTISDHLGNGRVWFSDLNEDGKVSCDHSEVLQEEHYYPFGMAQEGSWQNYDGNPEGTEYLPPAPNASNDNYTYNGKEIENDLTGWLDYGARWYDPSIGRFMNKDPLQDMFTPISPYSYSLNNPIRNVDVDGAFVLPAEFLVKHERLAQYLANDIQSLLQNERIVEGLKRFGGFTDEQLEKVFTWGQGPTIDIGQLDGADGSGKNVKGLHLSGNVFVIDLDLAEALQNASGRDRDYQLFLTALTILHETVHVGYERNIAPFEPDGQEMGDEFEKFVYGFINNRENRNKTKNNVDDYIEESNGSSSNKSDGESKSKEKPKKRGYHIYPAEDRPDR